MNLVEFGSNGDLLGIEQINEKIIRCVITRGDLLPSAMAELEKPPKDPRPNGFYPEERVAPTKARLRAEVDYEGAEIRFFNQENCHLLRLARCELKPIKAVRYTTGGEAPIVKRVKTVDGERSFIENLVPVESKDAYTAKLRFQLRPDTPLHGLGQFEEGIYDYRGQTQYLYQHNMRIPNPMLLSGFDCGLFIDCGGLITVRDTEYCDITLDTADQVDFYVMAGVSVDDVISGYRTVTGKAAMLPKWAFGFMQSKEAYKTADELVRVAERYRELDVPIDCVIQDWNTWPAGQWGQKTVDKTRYPDLKAAFDRLHELNTHVMFSVWPNMAEGCPDHAEFAREGLLLGDYSTYDASNERARELYFEQANRELFSSGLDGWWCDSTEPFSAPDWKGETKLGDRVRFELVGNEHKKYLDPARANLFSLDHARGIFENQRKAAPEKRVVNLTRSGCGGSQRYGTILWSGDISARWDVLRSQVVEGLNLAMSGLPYWTLDAGGFFVVKDAWQKRGCGCNDKPEKLWFWNGDFENGLEDLSYCELYVRWMQMATLLPIFRSHGTDFPREIWNFSKIDEPFYDSIVRFIRLRYRLMPYIYSLAGNVWLNDKTMFRSLLFDFYADEKARSISDQFMLGESLMVCPVTSPLYYDKDNKLMPGWEKAWDCYIPDALWHEITMNYKVRGKGVIRRITATLDRIPIFARAGSIIPMRKNLRYAAEPQSEPLEIHIYDGADGELTFYEDAGDGFGYERGEYTIIHFKWNQMLCRLTISEREGQFPCMKKYREFTIIRGPRKANVIYTGREVVCYLYPTCYERITEL